MMIRGAFAVLLLGVRHSPDHAHGFAPPPSLHKVSSPPQNPIVPSVRRRGVSQHGAAPPVALQASPALAAAFSAVGAPLGSVSVLALVILIHEMGRFSRT